MFKLTNPGNTRMLLPAIALFLTLTILLISCSDDKKEAVGQGEPSKKEFSMSPVTLTRAQLQAWVDSGWTKPDNPGRIKTLLLQFYSADAGSMNANMQLTAYPGTTATDVKISGNTLLAADSSSKPVKFSGRVILANNLADLDSLKVFNADGTLKEFDFVRFTPQTFSRNTAYVTFNADVVKKGGELETGVSGPTRPCPPFCCPPLCD